MRTTACKSISKYNTTEKGKSIIDPLPNTKNNASQYSYSSATAVRNSSPMAAAALHDSTISVDCPIWSMSPLSAALPESPPPICSDCSSPPCSSTTIFYSLAPTVISTSRFQSTRSNFSKPPTSKIEVEEWVQSGKNLSGFHHQIDEDIELQNSHLRRHLKPSAATPIHPEIQSRTLSSFLKEENSVHLKKHRLPDPECNHNRYGSDAESLESGHHKLMTRPKPYSEFLDEIKAQELEAQMGALKKAKHRELMYKLGRKETVIRDWEYKQTQKALKDMRKVENTLERKRAQALERAQKRINKARTEANKAAGKVRESAIKKLSTIAKESEIQGTNNPFWRKLTKLCS